MERIGFGEVFVGLLTLFGWSALALIVGTLPVGTGSETLFYLSGGIALSGTVALLLALRDGRLVPERGVPGAMGRLGSGVRVAVAVEFALWLQSLRAFNVFMALLVLAGYLCIEWVFRQAAVQRGIRRRAE